MRQAHTTRGTLELYLSGGAALLSLARVTLSCVCVLGLWVGPVDAADPSCPPDTEARRTEAAGLVAHWCARHDSTGERPHGPFRATWPNGARAMVGAWEDGAASGPWAAWYADDKPAWRGRFLMIPASYRDGRPSLVSPVLGWRPGVPGNAAATTEWRFWYEHSERARGERYGPVDVPPDGREDGTWTFWYQNGHKWREESYRSGRRHGSQRKWYASGQLEEESHRAERLREGRFARWRDDGSLIEQGTLKNGGLWGQKQGLWTGEHRGGGRAFAIYWVNGKPEGASTRWYPNGQLAEEGVRRAGEWTGRTRWFYANGSPRLVEERRDGEFHGVIESWGPDGARLSRAHYEHGKRHGLYERWHNTRTLAEKGSYVRGQPSGPWERFHPDGTPEKRSAYVAGEPDGTWVTWHPNGAVASEGEWVAGKKTGLWRSFHPNGAQLTQEQWRDGEPHGAFESWYPDGVPMLERHYEHGREVRSVKLNPDHEPFATSDMKATLFDVLSSGERRLWLTTLDCPAGTEPFERRSVGRWIDRGCADASGRREGPWRGWFARDVLRFEQSYRSGRVHGPVRHYHENGRVALEATYVDGVPHGAFRKWRLHGLTTEGEFDHGTPVGHWRLYSDYGLPTLDLDLDASGRPIGWTEWGQGYPTLRRVGEPAGEGLHRVLYYDDSSQGHLEGEVIAVASTELEGHSSTTEITLRLPVIRIVARRSTSWRADGHTETGGYVEGRRDGAWQIWRGDGSVERVIEYRAGEVVSELRD